MSRPALLFLNNQGLGASGGGVTILRALVAGLAADHDIAVASFDPPGPAPEGVTQLVLPPPPPGAWQFAPWHLAPWRLARHLAAVVPPLLPEAARVVALDCHFALALARLPPARLVYLSLSCIPRQEWFSRPGWRMLPRCAQYGGLERRLARRAGRVVVASRRHAAELRRFEALRIAPTVLAPVFPTASPPAPARRDPPLLVCLGRMTPVKRFHLALAAMARLRDLDWRLVLAGDGPLLPALRRDAARLGIADRVGFIGATEDVPSLLAGAALLLHPSAYESFGIAVFEAMAAGVPPVCAAGRAVTACAEFATDGESAMFVDFDRAAEAAGRIRALLLDPEERARRGAAARVASARLLGRDYVATFRAEVLDPLRDRP